MGWAIVRATRAPAAPSLGISSAAVVGPVVHLVSQRSAVISMWLIPAPLST